MIRRWRSIVHPETADRMRPPTAREAAALWFLGSAWLLYGTLLACAGLPLWLPAIPVAGLLAMWGWKRRGWLFWFPAAAVVAALLDARIEGAATGHLVDLVMTGMALVVVARTLARGWPRRAIDGAQCILFVALAVGAVLAVVDPRGATPRPWRIGVAGLAAFAAAWWATLHPPAIGRARLAFSLTAAALGAATLIAWAGGHAPAGHPVAMGTLFTLAAALPFSGVVAVRPGGAVVRPGRSTRWRVGVTVALGVLAASEGDPRFRMVATVLVATAAGLGWGAAAPRAHAHISPRSAA